jgi:hypothetical protein
VEKYKATLSFAKRSQKIGFVLDGQTFTRRLVGKVDECRVAGGKISSSDQKKGG